MRSTVRISLIILCCTLFLHCSDHSILGELHQRIPEPDVTVKDLSEKIVIAYGQTVLVEEEDLYISFTRVVEGRCPTGAVCFWEGQATVELRAVVPGDKPDTASPIMRPSGDPHTDRYMTDYALEYAFTIFRLEPYPDVDHDFDIEEYVATLEIVNVADDGGVNPIHITRQHPLLLQRDPVTVHEGTIDGDVLTLTVSYGGGCGNHAFKLYWKADFMESYPVQTNLFVQHVNIDDPCEAIISEERSYSIREIAEEYAESYGGYDDIILNVYGYFENEPGGKISVTYSPE